MPDDREIDAPVSLQGLWPDSDDSSTGSSPAGFDQGYETQSITVAGAPLSVRQYCFHSHNANRVWPGTFNLAEHYLTGSPPAGDLETLTSSGVRVLELGSATGVLAMRFALAGVEGIVTSDVADSGEVEENIRHNFEANGLPPPRHVRHTWGEGWPSGVENEFDVVLASDILLYVAAYPALVVTLKELIGGEGAGTKKFIMSWNRRMEESKEFFKMCEEGGFRVRHLGKCVYEFVVIKEGEGEKEEGT